MKRETEIWRAVPSQPGMMASNLGRILLPPKHVPMANGGYRTIVTRPVIGSVGGASKRALHKRRTIMVRDRGTLKIHQLVCEAFHGPAPFQGAVVIHVDEDGLNNHADNLRWGTQRENLNAPGFIAYCKGRTGENSPIAKAHSLRQVA